MTLTSNWTIAVSFVLAIGCAVERIPARADVNRQRVGDHWFNLKDRGYFKIFNILNEDVLLFAEPAFGSKIISPLKEGDIVASDGFSHWGGDSSWQRIAFGTSDGWIPQRQLIRARPRTLGMSGVPVAGACWGYDPVWTASWNEKMLRLSLFPGRAQIEIAHTTSSAQSQTSLLTAKSESLSADLIQTAEACAPVQGRYLFGTSGALVLTDGAGKRLLSGCCQADAAAF